MAVAPAEETPRPPASIAAKKEEEKPRPHPPVPKRRSTRRRSSEATMPTEKVGYGTLMKTLGRDAWISEEHNVHTRIIQMFHSHAAESSQKRILSSFVQRNTLVRCVIAAVVFGLGVQVPDVRHVVHWGRAADILSYW